MEKKGARLHKEMYLPIDQVPCCEYLVLEVLSLKTAFKC